MERILKIGYQNRQSRMSGGSGVGSYSRDLETVPKILLANHFLKDRSMLAVGDMVSVQYLPNSIIIKKLIH